MNETMSLVLATTILAIGGLGLYMYKTSDDPDYKNDYNEDELFDENEDDLSESESDSEDDLSIDSVDAIDDEYDKPKPKSRGKTKRAKKSGGTKRKY
jgi:hypothetical protein